ncbi:FKBP-type peptidyl-prolyl cis-trans isomerase [Aestuariibacter sp. AA17]|uniref:Peptidyl-prolyl cis-trans isomerase n=1 Tax=Fluctibacter corallii TaxID=2984329 RepID=A0ABT3ACX8_9ALTE|nr:FKBP-type peptidyl-prolyl cis-trans isomerase [Aestuariibacter sp. AA17]MCV2886126.1 FKBP-type peptidyl-prolyl cis-trans isomerase [Aestuariibacter sp. AA17]
MSNVINEKSEVLMHFDLKLEDGSAADSTRVHNKPAKLVMGDGSLTSNFEACLLGLKEGDKKAFTLSADDAFGQPNPDNIHHMDRTRFDSDTPLEAGTIIAFSQPDGSQVPGIIRACEGDSVTVDFNHPLAGQTVIFDVEILSVSN